MPLRALADLAAGPVLPALARGDAEAGDLAAVSHSADLGVSAEIADQGHAVQGAGHRFIPSCHSREGVPASCVPSFRFDDVLGRAGWVMGCEALSGSRRQV